jgi:hypothetical protein
MQVQSFDAVIGLPVVVEAVADDLLGSKLQICCLINIGRIFPSEEEVAIYESLLDQGFEDAASTILRT